MHGERVRMGLSMNSRKKYAGFPATPAGQKQVLDLVANIVASLPDEMGAGYLLLGTDLCSERR